MSSLSNKQATHFMQFEYPSKIPLTPSICTEIFMEFLKHIFYLRGQIELPFDQLMNHHTANQKKQRLSPKKLKVHHLAKTAKECSESIQKVFDHHYQNRLQSEKKSNEDDGDCNSDHIESIDILVLFGKSYLKPLEVYSLRFYLLADDDENMAPKLDGKTRQKIIRTISKNLLNLNDFVPDDLPKTECRVMANVNPSESDQNLRDFDFKPIHNLVFRKNKKMTLFKINVWNKKTSKAMIEVTEAPSEDADKENTRSTLQDRTIDMLMSREQGNRGHGNVGVADGCTDDDDDDSMTVNRLWYLSGFKFKGI